MNERPTSSTHGGTKSLRRLEVMLNDYRLLQNTRQAAFPKRAGELLNAARPIIDKIQERRKDTGERFNVFSALQLERREIYHSRFIAYLLNPSSHHDQDVTFLNCFLQFISHPSVSPGEAKHISVTAEFTIPSSGASIEQPPGIGAKGRIDIFIKTPYSTVVIENKIDAGEQTDQVRRYRGWLNEQSALNTKLVYLTPGGANPCSGEADVCMSYSELEECLLGSLKLMSERASALRSVITQYARLCRNVSTGEDVMAKIDCETYRFLTDEENLATALELAEQVALLKMEIKKRFVDTIAERLKKLLNDQGSRRVWDVEVEAESSRIVLRRKNPDLKYAIDQLFASGAWYGWHRPKGVDEDITLNLLKEMGQKGYI